MMVAKILFSREGRGAGSNIRKERRSKINEKIEPKS